MSGSNKAYVQAMAMILWKPPGPNQRYFSYLIHLFIKGFDQQGMAHKITNLISNDYQINIRVH